MIEKVLPHGVVGYDLVGDALADSSYKEERNQIRHAVQKRKREYTTVRHCARIALAQLGLQPTAIPRGKGGSPIWPDGITGSMTHCEQYRAAAAARTSSFLTIGIDAAVAEHLPNDLLPLVTTPRETLALRSLHKTSPHFPWGMLLFSAKESIFKAWYPIKERWLGFEDATVLLQSECLFSPSRGTFRVALKSNSDNFDASDFIFINCIKGQWQLVDRMILTCAFVETGSAHQ